MGEEKSSVSFISVDIETTGSRVGLDSMYQIGACLVSDTGQTFSGWLSPISCHCEPEALMAVGITWVEIVSNGEPPLAVMERFEAWVLKTSGHRKPVFVGFNAAFDWKFTDWYFLNFLGANPFGFAPLDIKALVMGALGCDWFDTKMSRLPIEVRPDRPLSHDGLDDAVQQAEIFSKTLALIRSR
jgi:DNA polymerase III alpha subunit (gram-positive type)